MVVTARATAQWSAAELLSVQEATQHLGIWREQVYPLMADGDLPYVQIGHFRAIPLSELRAHRMRRERRQ
jgi:excisionase family DNA binding protein